MSMSGVQGRDVGHCTSFLLHAKAYKGQRQSTRDMAGKSNTAGGYKYHPKKKSAPPGATGVHLHGRAGVACSAHDLRYEAAPLQSLPNHLGSKKKPCMHTMQFERTHCIIRQKHLRLSVNN